MMEKILNEAIAYRQHALCRRLRLALRVPMTDRAIMRVAVRMIKRDRLSAIR